MDTYVEKSGIGRDWSLCSGSSYYVTAEVAVSKIFPAGFGWQTAATLAEGAGMQTSDLSFYLATGVGDGIGVLGAYALHDV